MMGFFWIFFGDMILLLLVGIDFFVKGELMLGFFVSMKFLIFFSSIDIFFMFCFGFLLVVVIILCKVSDFWVKFVMSLSCNLLINFFKMFVFLVVLLFLLCSDKSFLYILMLVESIFFLVFLNWVSTSLIWKRNKLMIN